MKIRFICFICYAIFCELTLYAQIENVLVETYYISGSQDTLDSFGGYLPEGSFTYRVFFDLEEGYALKALIGDPVHPFIISSSDSFFNHPLGQDFNQNFDVAFYPLGNLPLDSWLTLAYASKNHLGVPKIKDLNGSIVGGTNNLNGMISSEISQAGIPVTSADGLVPALVSSVNLNFYTSINDSTFGNRTSGNYFVFDQIEEPDLGNLIRVSEDGIQGADSDNMILVAQLTTLGELEFKMNCEIISLTDSVPFGGTYEKLTYTVFHSDSLLPQSSNSHKYLHSNLLSYPAKCGCTDPWFVEYNSAATCDDGSCNDSIVLGCMDPAACNYDPSANFNVLELCCFGPDSCDNRDVKTICPNWDGENKSTFSAQIYPNPTGDFLKVSLNSVLLQDIQLDIYDSFGQLIHREIIANAHLNVEREYITTNWNTGIYLVSCRTEKEIFSFTAIKQ